MTGENHGALLTVSELHSRVESTARQKRHDQHSRDAWKMVFNLAKVQAAEHRLVASLLNPERRPCWGFKEIRYGRPDGDGRAQHSFARDLRYLASLCAQPGCTRRRSWLWWGRYALCGRHLQPRDRRRTVCVRLAQVLSRASSSTRAARSTPS